jgi:hypothetical protein
VAFGSYFLVIFCLAAFAFVPPSHSRTMYIDNSLSIYGRFEFAMLATILEAFLIIGNVIFGSYFPLIFTLAAFLVPYDNLTSCIYRKLNTCM